MTTKIIGTGSYVPAQIVTNDDLSKIVETNDQWIRSRTGIGERRIATDDSTSDMAAKAAARAIEQAGIREFDTSKLKRILQSLETGLFFCQIFVFII